MTNQFLQDARTPLASQVSPAQSLTMASSVDPALLATLVMAPSRAARGHRLAVPHSPATRGCPALTLLLDSGADILILKFYLNS